MKSSTASMKRRGWPELLPAVALLIVSAVGIAAAALSPSGDGGQYAVVTPPWYDRSETMGLVAIAGGDIIDFGGSSNVVIAHSDNPGFVRGLYHAGAWLVIDPVILRGCLKLTLESVPTLEGA
jgi:hypothetical protein